MALWVGRWQHEKESIIGTPHVELTTSLLGLVLFICPSTKIAIHFLWKYKNLCLGGLCLGPLYTPH